MQEINFIRPQELRASSSSHVLQYKGYDGIRYLPTYSNASDTPLMPSDVVDALNSTEAAKPLSAKQGKVLNDKLASYALKTDLTGLAKVVALTHAELAAAKAAGELVAGYIYNITDYPLGGSDPTGDVLILATAADTLATNAWVMPTVTYADPSSES